MRILLVTPNLDRHGGVANYYRTVRRHFEAGVEVFETGRRTGREFSLVAAWQLLRDYARFVGWLRRGRYDLVILNPSLAPIAVVRDAVFLLISKFMGRSTVVFFRGWHPGCERFISRFAVIPFRCAYRRADAVIVLATPIRERLLDWGLRMPIYLETTVVDDTQFSAAAERRRDRRESSNGSVLSLLFLSRIKRHKGVYETIDAFEILKRQHPGLTLTIAGDGPDCASVKAYAHRVGTGGVSFPGFVRGDAKTAILENADIFVLPTYHGEGMPNAVLEAMAAGLPVITRPVGGLRDFFQDGNMGLLTESTEPAEIARLIDRLLADPALRRRMCEFNRAYAREHFAASTVARRLEQIWKNVLRQSATEADYQSTVL